MSGPTITKRRFLGLLAGALVGKDASAQSMPSFTIVGDSIGLRASRYGSEARTTAVTGQPISEITQQLNGIRAGSNIVVFGGTNDANGAMYSADNLMRNAENLIRRARTRNLNILLWVGPPDVVSGSAYDRANRNLAGNLIDANDVLEKFLPTQNVPFMSLQTGIQFTHAFDGLHQSETGPNVILNQVRSRIAGIVPTPPIRLQPPVTTPRP